jgi:hypothetical protein
MQTPRSQGRGVFVAMVIAGAPPEIDIDIKLTFVALDNPHPLRLTLRIIRQYIQGLEIVMRPFWFAAPLSVAVSMGFSAHGATANVRVTVDTQA